MILKRVVFGVDKNPMAVELAKVGLWLHTFTVGAPLSFLDHHLQCGDSLHGESLAEVRSGLAALGTLFQEGEMTRLSVAAQSLESVAELTDTSIAEAHESKRLAAEAQHHIAPIHALLDLWRGLRWLVPGWPTTKLGKLKDEAIKLALAELFSDRYNLVLVAAAGRIGVIDEELAEQEDLGETIAAVNALLKRIFTLARREHFFHWQTAFPTVWNNGQGGFDAIIGNPPWDRIKLQEIEWFAERKPAIALQARAADRKALIDREKQRNSRLWREYQAAQEAAEAGSRVIRESGDYPLLSGGDINLYSLFVERANALVAPDGHRRPAHALRHCRRQGRFRLFPHAIHRAGRRKLPAGRAVRFRKSQGIFPGCRFTLQVLRAGFRRRKTPFRQQPLAPSTCTMSPNWPIPSACWHSPPPTLRWSTRTPAPRPFSAAHAMPN